MSAVFLWRWPFVQETGLVDHLHTRNNNETMREWLGGGICKTTWYWQYLCSPWHWHWHDTTCHGSCRNMTYGQCLPQQNPIPRKVRTNHGSSGSESRGRIQGGSRFTGSCTVAPAACTNCSAEAKPPESNERSYALASHLHHLGTMRLMFWTWWMLGIFWGHRFWMALKHIHVQTSPCQHI